LANRLGRFCPETPEKPLREKTCLKNLSSFEEEHPWHDRDFLAKKLFTTADRAKSVRPVWETGQTGFVLDSREEVNPWEKLKPSTNRTPDSFHGSK
jgi:hypothetical protein